MHPKIIISAIARFHDGQITPISITWPDGSVFEIDRVIDVRTGPAKSGGYGTIFTVEIRGKKTRVYFDAEEGNVWWMDGKAAR